LGREPWYASDDKKAFQLFSVLYFHLTILFRMDLR
jgi:hypothetical protein